MEFTQHLSHRPTKYDQTIYRVLCLRSQMRLLKDWKFSDYLKKLLEYWGFSVIDYSDGSFALKLQNKVRVVNSHSIWSQPLKDDYIRVRYEHCFPLQKLKTYICRNCGYAINFYPHNQHKCKHCGVTGSYYLAEITDRRH